MTTLRLYLPETWPTEPSCEWVLLGGNGQVEAAGSSAPRNWPAAKRTEVVLAGPQTIYLRLRLPKGTRRPSAKLIAYGLEDQLIRDPEKQHFTLARREDDKADVIVADRERLTQVIAQLSALGRAPGRMVSELEVAQVVESPEPGAWSLVRQPQHAILLGAAALPACVDSDGDAPPAALLAQLGHAHTQNQLPARLLIHNGPGLGAIDAEAWSAQLGIPVDLGSTYDWHRIEPACNLLHGEFRGTTAESGLLRALRPPLYVFGAVLACSLLASVITILVQRNELSHTRQSIQAAVRSALPGQPLIDPVAQLNASLIEAQHQHGQLGENDFLALLAGFSDSTAGDAAAAIKSLSYGEGKLGVAFANGDPGIMEGVAGRLRSRGYQARVADSGELTITREAKR